jgi:hypothetical protein
MHLLRFPALSACLLLPAAIFAADVTTEGTLALGGGGALLDGDRPAFQKLLQQRKDGYGGVEEFRLLRETKEHLFKFELRALPGADDYRVGLSLQRPEKWFVSAGYSQYRVWYDGSSGYFAPTATSFVLFNEDLSIKRSKLWLEAGAYLANQTLVNLRYERNGRDGRKNSTSWADTNLVGTFGTRNIVPSFYDFDEVTHLFTFDLGNDTQEQVKWNVGARYQETETDNRKWSRRRPFEPTADRQITTTEGGKTDIFAVHGFYERKVNEQLTVSAGALRTDLDATLHGSRIYGQTYDPVYDPAYARRQQRDEGYYDLETTGEIKQTVLNLNAVYVPRKNWSVRPSIRFENLHQETMSEFMETNIGAGPAFAAIIEEGEGDHRKKWNEFSENLEIRYTGKPNWTFSGEALWLQGEGNVEEERILHHTIVSVDRDVENERRSQKYSLKANWYAKPGLTLAAQYYFKINTNDFDAVRDNTPPGSADRYPAYITDQDYETHDLNFRVSWRPMSLLSLVSRYDMQQSKIVSQEAGLEKDQSSKYLSHILSQSVTWNPTARLYLTGSVNVTYDQFKTPAYLFVQHGDNNYVNGSLSGGYAVGKLDDLFVDYSWFRASNFIDNSALSMPYGLNQRLQQASLTWVRRQTEHLIYTLKYGYVTNRDGTWSGLNNFDAHVIYAKVQYHF